VGDALYTADAVRAAPLDSLTALYHPRSGMTHVVAEPVPEILAGLTGRVMTADALLAALGVAADDDAMTALAARLDELEQVGLVSRA
jgi:PqqD family protein of HPr-rel-A system